MIRIRSIALVLTLATLYSCSETAAPTSTVCFTQEVQPLIHGGCAKSGCHDSTTKAGGIALITHSEISSVDELIEVINGHEVDELMPPPPWKKLSDAQIELISRWVGEGRQNTSCDPVALPDTSAVSYTSHVVPIIDVYCIGCHQTQASGSGPLLNTYEQVKYETEFGNLMPCVSHESGYVPMPPGRTRVSDREIELLRLWKTNGYRRV